MLAELKSKLHLTTKKMKLLESTEKAIKKDKMHKVKQNVNQRVPNLEITEVVLVYCNVVNNDY